MRNAITVIHAGSSSIKFSVFAEDGSGLWRVLAGSIKGLGAPARYVVKDGAGQQLALKGWPQSTSFGRDEATVFLFETVPLHLGNGASMCAMRDGTSVATTMGCHRAGRLADGYPLRRPGPGRGAVADDGTADGTSARAELAVPAIGSARRIRHFL